MCTYIPSSGSECKVAVGVLNLKLELYPPLTETLSPDVITTQVNHCYINASVY